MATDGVIMQCIKGEEWPVTEFKSFIEALDEPLTEASIVFLCPVNHRFSLKQALSKGIFTKEQGQKILNQAKEEKGKYQKRDWSIWQASDLLLDEKVTALNLPCIRCGEAAQRRIGRFVLCRGCVAAWFNYDKREAFDLLDRTHGKPSELFWDSIFDRFLNNLPPLDFSAAEKLLTDCRKEAKKSRLRRPR